MLAETICVEATGFALGEIHIQRSTAWVFKYKSDLDKSWINYLNWRRPANLICGVELMCAKRWELAARMGQFEAQPCFTCEWAGAAFGKKTGLLCSIQNCAEIKGSPDRPVI